MPKLDSETARTTPLDASDIAWQVRKLVKSPGVTEAFREHVLAWKGDPPVAELLSFCRCEANTDYDYPETLPDPHRVASMAERYVILSAIHDVWCSGAEKIDPWGDVDWDGELDEAAIRNIKDGQSYKVLCAEVECLHEADRPAIADSLADVKMDLSSQTLVNDGDAVLHRDQEGLQDGPFPPNSFRWKGGIHLLTEQEYQIATVVWGMVEPLDLNEFIKEVWPTRPSDNSVRTAIYRFNDKLSLIGASSKFTLSQRKGFLYNTAASDPPG